ncbi:hypothetical protein UFOVP584_10 [uncultured Caudovirales phage]|uniref:Uncharacterized protein n=1 Tax=uncultured Caudovirales phage TaxID=2100421 RepID=A0A6J5LRQ2_9CAUD|nr:hypothetical protein UFOVP304_45 [uncultured Caudovirales phage]CAB4151305.1 hypothetical protein UFOVP584_10 [uncultured Caudovirales phage]
MNFPNEISGTFNRNIVLGSGFLKVYKDNVLFLTFTEADITISNNVFSIDVSNMFPDNGDYFILFNKGLFKSVLGEDYDGVTDITKWTFTIASGQYNSSQYSNDYLI